MLVALRQAGLLSLWGQVPFSTALLFSPELLAGLGSALYPTDSELLLRVSARKSRMPLQGRRLVVSLGGVWSHPVATPGPESYLPRYVGLSGSSFYDSILAEIGSPGEENERR